MVRWKRQYPGNPVPTSYSDVVVNVKRGNQGWVHRRLRLILVKVSELVLPGGASTTIA